MQANIVLAKLPQLQPWITRKQDIAAYYDQQLQYLVKTIKHQPDAEHGHYVYVIQTPQRDQLKNFWESRGIGTNIHYATTTHVQPAFSRWYRPCPVAEQTVKEILSLPCRYDLTDQEVEYVVSTVKEFFQ
jgi:dTDP-4-amino-4,6-dideoxygalactose transaminase